MTTRMGTAPKTRPRGERSLMAAACLLPALLGLTSPAGELELEIDPVRGELVVFTQPGVSEVAVDFEKTWLGRIRELAEVDGVRVRVVEISASAPPEVHITPLLVYQNYLGRSIYQGRYASPGRFENFLRTFRHVPQGTDPLVRKDAPVLTMGRVRVAAQIKITPLAGDLPPGHDDKIFRGEARASLGGGLRRFQETSRVELDRSDRLYFMDFYPYLDGVSGLLSVSVALFSQFHCKDAVFRREGVDVVSGPWEERDRVFARAAEVLEEAVLESIASTRHGDGFDPVASEAEPVTWSSLGLDLPPPPEKEMAPPPSKPLVRDWVAVEQTEQMAPMVQFRFPSPLDGYSGWAREVRARLTLGEGLKSAGTRGAIDIPNRSLTMGDVGLDETLHMPNLLASNAHPVSQFRLVSVEGPPEPLAFGNQTLVTVRGTLVIKGRELPVEFPAMFEPIVDSSGEPRLSIAAAFQIRLKQPFDIEGPLEGPWPQSDMVNFDISLLLRPASK